jgi:SAM-dependent methyltransferase
MMGKNKEKKIKKVLDIGCGDCQSKLRKEFIGWKYIGFDRKKPADIIGDMHNLPFKNNEFDKVISFAVMQYSNDVHTYLKEIKRVLKKNCIFEGTVAYVEPWHGELYHYSPEALKLILEKHFREVNINSSDNWHGLTAIYCMNLFPGIGIKCSKIITYPTLLLSKIYWKIGHLFKPSATEHNRQLRGAGSLHFICRK